MSVTRRSLFRTTAVVAGSIASATLVPIALAQSSSGTSEGNQLSKQAADYRSAPNGDQRCSLCTNFQSPSACLVVAGVVVPNGWCKLFKPKSG
jgi:hypothetical protein